HHNRCVRHSSARPAADRCVAAASVHGSRPSRVQHVPMDAAERRPRRRHPAGGFDDLHDVVRGRRKPRAILEQHRNEVIRQLCRTAGLLAATMLLAPNGARAQSRGVYPLGMTAIGSGVTPNPDFTYANQLLFYSRDESKADDGSTLPVSGQNAVIMDMNSFVWVSRQTLLGGAHYSAVATLPIAKNQLVSDVQGQLSGGGGFADSYYLPLVLGWDKESAWI